MARASDAPRPDRRPGRQRDPPRPGPAPSPDGCPQRDTDAGAVVDRERSGHRQRRVDPPRLLPCCLRRCRLDCVAGRTAACGDGGRGRPPRGPLRRRRADRDRQAGWARRPSDLPAHRADADERAALASAWVAGAAAAFPRQPPRQAHIRRHRRRQDGYRARRAAAGDGGQRQRKRLPRRRLRPCERGARRD